MYESWLFLLTWKWFSVVHSNPKKKKFDQNVLAYFGQPQHSIKGSTALQHHELKKSVYCLTFCASQINNIESFRAAVSAKAAHCR